MAKQLTKAGKRLKLHRRIIRNTRLFDIRCKLQDVQGLLDEDLDPDGSISSSIQCAMSDVEAEQDRK